ATQASRHSHTVALAHFASSTPKAVRAGLALKPTSSSSTANPPPKSHGPKSSGINDLRTNKHFTLKEPSSSEIDWRSVSLKGQRCSADQNPLKRSDLDDFVNCWFGRARSPSAPKETDGPAVRPYQLSRHERKESERFKSFTYE